MTNHDNVGGLVWYVCTSCLLMVQLPSDTPKLGRCQCSPGGWSLRRVKLPKGYELCRAPGDVGGLPELPDPEYPADDEFVDGMKVWPAHPDYYTADQMRAYGELCRAAPAGGEPVVVRDIEAERKLASRGTPGIDRLWDTQWVNIVNHDACYFGYTVEEAVNTAVKLTEQKMAENFKAAAQDSGPAGSGEVDEDVEGLSRSLELMAEGRDAQGMNCDAECLRTAAALLRKLQQGADGWMPIESAPKDGSLFLCWVDAVRYGERDDGSLDTADCSDVDFCQWRDSEHGGYFMNMMGDIGDGQNITHWRPMPGRPASQGQEGGHARD